MITLTFDEPAEITPFPRSLWLQEAIYWRTITVRYIDYHRVNIDRVNVLTTNLARQSATAIRELQMTLGHGGRGVAAPVPERMHQ
jgi:hypothetical protein